MRPQHTSISFYSPISPPFAVDRLNTSLDIVNSTYNLQQPLGRDNSLIAKSPEDLLRAKDQRSKALVGLLIAEENRRIMARRSSVSDLIQLGCTEGYPHETINHAFCR